MARINASDNEIVGSEQVQVGCVIHNNYNGSTDDEVLIWLSQTVRPARSITETPPYLFATNLTESIFQDAKFKACVARKAATLLLRGQMGAGKTATVQGLIKKLRDETDVMLAFVLFDFESPEDHIASRVLMRFVEQLVNLSNTEHRKYLVELRQKFSRQCPPADAAADMIVSIINSKKGIGTEIEDRVACILLDGLDEIGNQDECHALLRYLEKIQKRTHCGIVATGWPERTTFGHYFEEYEAWDISAQQEDVKSFVSEARRDSIVQGLIRLKPKRIEEIGDAVYRGSSGSFLLAKLNASRIMAVTSKAEYTKTLDRIRTIRSPFSSTQSEFIRDVLSEALQRPLQRLSRHKPGNHSGSAPSGGDVLTIMRDSLRTLQVRELLYLLVLLSTSAELDSRDLWDSEGILKSTQGLVNILSDGYARFIHPWLKRHLLEHGTIPGSTLDTSNSQVALAKACIDCLSWRRISSGPCMTRRDLENRVFQSPLLDYAAKNWMKHYDKARRFGGEHTSLRKSLLRFLRNEKSVSSSQQLMFLPEPIWIKDSTLHDPVLSQDSDIDDRPLRWPSYAGFTKSNQHDTTGLHLAITLDLHDIAVDLATELDSKSLSCPDGNGDTPLHTAIIMRRVHHNRALIELLINLGADINVPDRKGFSPWHLAAACGNSRAVEQMMGRPHIALDVNATVQPEHEIGSLDIPDSQSDGGPLWIKKPMCGATALHLASRNDHLDIVVHLIKDNRVNVALEDVEGMTAFHKAWFIRAHTASLENVVLGHLGVTKKLNKIVPSLNRENLQRFQEHSKVHTPLQQLFGAYMEVYLTFFSKSAPPGKYTSSHKIDKARFFETRKEEWQRAFEAAQVEEQKRMKDSFGSANGSVQDREPAQPASARFVRLNDLGQGAFGQVYVARQHSTGDLFALKFVSAPNAAQDSGMRKKLKSMVINEVATSKKLQHHHVASVLLWTEETNGFNLVMPTVGDCNLLTFLERCIVAGFPDEQTKLLDNWFGCLATALKFAHANKVIHEDIKPSNILIKDNRVYLADFGCARDYEGRPSSKSPNEHIAGTPVYWPPESEGHRGKGADIFALGCVFSEMLTVRQGRSLADYQAMRKVPDRDNPYAYNKNLDAVQRWLRELSDTRHGLTKLLLEVIVKMLEANVEERLDSRELKMRLPEPLFCGSCL
ncbi:hypothetical protein MBLNU13_g08305t2 [Cladosporium sp. NU13]